MTKKFVAATLIAVLFSVTVPTASKGAEVVSKKFSNCTALNKVYPGGVAKSAKWKNKGGEIKNKPVVNAKVYNENSSRDRDKDGLACEN